MKSFTAFSIVPGKGLKKGGLRVVLNELVEGWVVCIYMDGFSSTFREINNI